jgi:hypothetical protein
MVRLASISLLLVAACAADPSTSGNTAGEGKADGTEPTIAFNGDFSQTVTGHLLAGSPVRVQYSLDRVTACKGESNNSDVWGASGFAAFDSGEQTSFEVSRLASGHTVPVDAEVQLPASATSVSFWFTSNNEWGCIAYDSNYGNNYTFSIDRHGLGAVLDFGGDWSFSQSAPVHAGDQIVVHYSPDRLSQCYALSNEMAAWGITAHWQVDGGAVHDVMAARPDGSQLVSADPVISVPRGHDLALWFEATSAYGCHAWDSAYGANYHVTIQ